MTNENNQEEQLPNLGYNSENLASVMLALDFFKQGKKEHAGKTLCRLLDGIGVKDPIARDILRNEQVLPKTIESYLSTYQKFEAQKTISNVFEMADVQKGIEKIVGEEHVNFSEKIVPFKDKKFHEVSSEIQGAMGTLQNYKDTGYGEEDAKKAEEVLKGYSHVIPLVNTYSHVQQNRFNPLKAEIEEEVFYEQQAQMFKQLTQPAQEKPAA